MKISLEKEIYNHKLGFVIKTPLYVFNDCNIKKMHNTYTPSKLLEIIIAEKNGYKKLSRYLSLVDLYENDSLPFYKSHNEQSICPILKHLKLGDNSFHNHTFFLDQVS